MAVKNSVEITILHIATGRQVILTSFGLSEYADTLDASWNSADVYGRMDPIMTYQGTKREIAIGLQWDGLGKKTAEVVNNQITKLMTFQYPTYAGVNNALAIQSPPLVRVTFANFGKGLGTGLLCAMKGVAYTPGVGFTPQDSPYVRWGKDGEATISPTKVSLKLDLTVLHEESLGWHFNHGPAAKVNYGFMLPEGASFGPGTIKGSPLEWAWDKQPPPKKTGESDKKEKQEEPPAKEDETWSDEDTNRVLTDALKGAFEGVD